MRNSLMISILTCIPWISVSAAAQRAYVEHSIEEKADIRMERNPALYDGKQIMYVAHLSKLRDGHGLVVVERFVDTSTLASIRFAFKDQSGKEVPAQVIPIDLPKESGYAPAAVMVKCSAELDPTKIWKLTWSGAGGGAGMRNIAVHQTKLNINAYSGSEAQMDDLFHYGPLAGALVSGHSVGYRPNLLPVKRPVKPGTGSTNVQQNGSTSTKLSEKEDDATVATDPIQDEGSEVASTPQQLSSGKNRAVWVPVDPTPGGNTPEPASALLLSLSACVALLRRKRA